MPSQYLLSFAIPISCYKAFRNDDDGVRDADVIDSRREIRKVTLVNVFATSQGVGWAPNRIWWNRSCAIGFFFSFFFFFRPQRTWRFIQCSNYAKYRSGASCAITCALSANKAMSHTQRITNECAAVQLYGRFWRPYIRVGGKIRVDSGFPRRKKKMLALHFLITWGEF